jgi:hypothetical protein
MSEELVPHAVTRLEWWDQKVEIARVDRLREMGVAVE